MGLRRAQLDQDEHGQQHDAGDAGRDDLGGGPRLQRALGHAVHEQPETGAAEHEPGDVEPSRRPSGAERSRKSAPKTMAAMPMGRFTKKTQRQVKVVTSSPPSTGPRAGARVVGTVRMLAARTRSAGGKTRYSMAMPTGAIMPPPAPWRTRNTTSWSCSAPGRTARTRR